MTNMTTPIVEQIEKAVETIPGWSPIDQLSMLFALTLSSSHLEGDVLEVGSWCGRSAVVLGMAARLCEGTKVHCVDLFPDKEDWYQNEDGTYSLSVVIDGAKIDALQQNTVWAEPYERDIAPIYDRFRSTWDAFDGAIKTNGLQDIVTPYKATINTFAKAAPDDLKVRLAFLDGDHGFDAVCNDIETVERFLVPGGWICFDDAFSFYDGINAAIRERVIDNPGYDCCQQLTRKFFVARRKPV